MSAVSQRLADRVAIVTGGGWNIGRAVAETFARAGARVVVTARRRALLDETVASIEAAGGSAMAVLADLTDPAQAADVVDNVLARHGRVDVLAAFAGGGSVPAPAHELSGADFDRVLRQNLSTTFNSVRAVLPSMRARDAGRIITCTGGGGPFAVLAPDVLAYACAKAAVCRLTDQLTAELLASGIRVNCIDPGRVPHAAELAALEAEERRSGHAAPDAPHRRRPDDVAELALWLASEAEVRGRVLSVYDTWWRDRDEAVRVEGSIAACRLRRADPR